MTFSKVVCWKPDELFVRLSSEADFAEDAAFLATHTDYPLTLVTNASAQNLDTATRKELEPEVFLDQFLDPARPRARTVILGSSGAGKSHLIHWLNLRIPASPARHVLSIPRSRTNLRLVLEQIIGVLPKERQARYGDRLALAGFHDQPREQRIRSLIANIALALTGDPRPRVELSEAEQYLLGGLADLFLDPNYRDYLASRGTIGSIVDHMGETNPAYEGRENRLGFEPGDLPLEAVQITRMSAKAQEVLTTLLGDTSLASDALRVLNEHLNTAVGLALNFTGEHLMELMSDVRAELHDRGKELVLLIEDLALLQGLDTALMDALLVDSTPGERPLCRLRWAMAVTTGYYRQSPQTLQTRVDFLIDMDRHPTNGVGAFNDEQIAPFAALYLNAARLDNDSLAAWFEEARASDEEMAPPNPCQRCVHREPCHEAFGSSNAIGLYPFNNEALVQMAHRTGAVGDGAFNPRKLIKSVLIETLVRSDELTASAFPSTNFLATVGGPQLSPSSRQRIRDQGSEEWERQATVLEVWSRVSRHGEPGPVTTGTWPAFDVPPLTHVSPSPDDGKLPPQAVVVAVTAQPLNPHVDAVRRWANGGAMSAPTANELRPLLFAAVASAIDWDAEALERSTFTRTRWFVNTSFAFARQTTQDLPRRVRVEVVADDALALEALLLLSAHRSLGTLVGSLLVALRNTVARWAELVARQIHAGIQADGGIRQVGAAVELLVTALVLSPGVVRPESSEGWLAAIFEELPAAADGPFSNVYKRICDKAGVIRSVMGSVISAGKGGVVGGIIDASTILPHIERFTSRWTFGPALPENVEHQSTDVAALQKLHARVRIDVPALAQRELDERVAALKRIRQSWPEEVSPAIMGSRLDAFRQTAADAGVLPAGRTAQAFDQARAMALGQTLQTALTTTGRMAKAPPSLLRDLQFLARSELGHALQEAARLVEAAKVLVDDVEKTVALRRNELLGGGDDEHVRDEITAELDRTIGLLQTAGGLMMLLERMAAAQDAIKGLEDLKKLENSLERLRTRRDALEAARKALEPQVDVLEALERHGIPVDHDGKPARLSESLRRTAERFREDPATIMEPDPNLKYVFWDTPEAPAAALRLRLITAWQNYVDSVVPSGNKELVELLAAIPSFQASVQRIQQALADIQQLRTRLPQSDADFATPKTLAVELASGWAHLANAGVTDAIERFLRQLTSGGARLSLLTSEVVSWLEQNGIYDFLRIRM